MPIIQIIGLSTTKILALNQEGCIICWDLSTQRLVQDNVKDYPFLKHDWYEKVLQSKAVALIQVKDVIVVCGEKQIKVASLSDILDKCNKGKTNVDWKSLKQQDTIQSMTILQKSLCPSLQQMQDQHNEPQQQPSVLFSTKSSKLYNVTLSLQSPTLICSIHDSIQNQQISNNSYTHSHQSWSQYITCMIPFRDYNLLLVGTNQGRILIINLNIMKVVQDVTARNGVKGGACFRMFVSYGGHRFYTVHEKGVFQWSMQLQKCQGYYAYPNPYCAAYTEKLSMDSPKILIAGGSKYLQIIDSQDPKKLSQIETNIDCVSVIKEIDNKIYLGGSHNSIEVLQSGIAYLILFKAEESSFV